MAKITPEGEDAKVDPELENGPIDNRYCTDILCCLLFLASIGAMIGIFAYGIANGDPQKLLSGYDPDGIIQINPQETHAEFQPRPRTTNTFSS